MTVRIEILIIGNEILAGHTLDTNSHWLAQRLFKLDLPVNHIQVIEDHVDSIAAAITDSISRNTMVLITSGGLGPTFDDLTAEGLALAAGSKLELNPDALQMVTTRYSELKAQNLVESREITPAREKMARLPINAEPLPNSVGSAPGIKLEINQTWVYCLPGVPMELHAMFNLSVAHQIAPLSKKVVLQDIIQVPILDESKLAPLLEVILKKVQGIYLKSLPRPYQSRQPLRVAITATANSKSQAHNLLQKGIKKLKKITTAYQQT